jgi:hypothetical protein
MLGKGSPRRVAGRRDYGQRHADPVNPPMETLSVVAAQDHTIDRVIAAVRTVAAEQIMPFISRWPGTQPTAACSLGRTYCPEA